ncbi:MAG: ParB N-terminal domain-containing protein [Pirellulaceae bacterium]|nr:ParB N-terminal domain-containing protein [Pirellulaceae bacterium]
MTATSKRQSNSKLSHDSVSARALSEIRPAPENDDIYGVIDPDDPEIIALAASIHEHGIREPIVVSKDGYILSGHRRYTAAKRLKLKTVPCRVESIRRTDDIDRFVLLLREDNRQRDKSLAVKLREELVNANPTDAHRALSDYRYQQSFVEAESFAIEGVKQRCKISKAKIPFLNAIIDVLNNRRKFWPLSDRAIHYGLLNNPPLKHASKPGSTYDNTAKSYNALGLKQANTPRLKVVGAGRAASATPRCGTVMNRVVFAS